MLKTRLLHIGIYIYFYSLQIPALVSKRWIPIYLSYGNQTCILPQEISITVELKGLPLIGVLTITYSLDTFAAETTPKLNGHFYVAQKMLQ